MTAYGTTDVRFGHCPEFEGESATHVVCAAGIVHLFDIDTHLTIVDDSDMAEELPEDDEGEYHVETTVRIERESARED